MQLARLDLSCAELEMLPVLISEEDRPLVVRVSDADTVTALAGVAGDWEGSWGVWLEPGEDYGIGALARDVRTLAQLIELDHVVLDHAHAEHYAVALDALLRGEEVSVENETLVLRADPSWATASPSGTWRARASCTPSAGCAAAPRGAR